MFVFCNVEKLEVEIRALTDFSLGKDVAKLMTYNSRIKDKLFVKFSLTRSSQVVSVSSSMVKQALSIKVKRYCKHSPSWIR